MSESGRKGEKGGRRKSHDRKLKSKSSNHSTSRRRSDSHRRHAHPSRKRRTSKADSDSSDSDKADSKEGSSSSSERDKPRQKKRERPRRHERERPRKNSRHERKKDRQRHGRDRSSRDERSRPRRGRHESERDRGRNSRRGERSMHSSHSSRSPPSSYRSSRSRRSTNTRASHRQDDDDSDDDDDEDDEDMQNPQKDTNSMSAKTQSQFQTQDGFNNDAIRANSFENYPVICKCVNKCSKCCSPQVPFYIISVFDIVMGALLIALCVTQPYIVEATYRWSEKTTTMLARTDPKKALKITHLDTLHAVFLALTGVLYVIDGIILIVGVFQHTVGPCILHAVFIFLNTFLLATCLVLFDVYTTSILTAYRKNSDLWSSTKSTSENLEFAEHNKKMIYGLYIGMAAVLSLMSMYFSICSYLYAKYIRAQNDYGELSFFRSIVHSFDDDIQRQKYEETEDD